MGPVQYQELLFISDKFNKRLQTEKDIEHPKNNKNIQHKMDKNYT